MAPPTDRDSQDESGGPQPRRRRLPPPSRRQLWLTGVLVAIVVVVGVVALVAKPGGPSGPTPVATGSPPTPSTVPASNPQASADAAQLETALRQRIGGCWDEAEPGADDGAYRQDYHYPGAVCGGSGWDIDVQIFGTTAEAQEAAATAARGRKAYVSPFSLIIVTADAAPTVGPAVAAQPGVGPPSS